MSLTSVWKTYGIGAAILALLISTGRVRADTNLEKTIRDFFTAMSAGDAVALNRVLAEKVAIIGAGRARAQVGFTDATDANELLPPDGKLGKIEVSSVKLDVSPTHRSVAVASFTLNIRFTKQQLADAEGELKQNPSNAELRKWIAEGGMKASMFAMLAGNHDGTWKIVCVSLPS